ncbi:MAG TPA: hypothetical protein VL096_03140 [Pirellulaceae bacterium]|nr:hypothetical protein [Pirellulaceae bacterium]
MSDENARPAIYGMLATIGLIAGSIIVAAVVVNLLSWIFGF